MVLSNFGVTGCKNAANSLWRVLEDSQLPTVLSLGSQLKPVAASLSSSALFDVDGHGKQIWETIEGGFTRCLRL